MRASVVIVVLISVVGFLLSGCETQRSINSEMSPSNAKDDANWKSPPDGDYLREDYLRSIREKRSTLNYPPHELEAIRVSTKDKQTLLMFIWNFHEGSADSAVGRDGRLWRTGNDPILEETYRISAAAGDSFEILAPENFAGKFLRVSTI